jgi:hypothetical protein
LICGIDVLGGEAIIIIPDPEVDSVKEPGPGLHVLTRVNPEKIKRELVTNIYIYHSRTIYNTSTGGCDACKTDMVTN